MSRKVCAALSSTIQGVSFMPHFRKTEISDADLEGTDTGIITAQAEWGMSSREGSARTGPRITGMSFVLASSLLTMVNVRPCRMAA